MKHSYPIEIKPFEWKTVWHPWYINIFLDLDAWSFKHHNNLYARLLPRRWAEYSLWNILQTELTKAFNAEIIEKIKNVNTDATNRTD